MFNRTRPVVFFAPFLLAFYSSSLDILHFTATILSMALNFPCYSFSKANCDHNDHDTVR
jgi:hypothetical protein